MSRVWASPCEDWGTQKMVQTGWQEGGEEFYANRTVLLCIYEAKRRKDLEWHYLAIETINFQKTKFDLMKQYEDSFKEIKESLTSEKC